MTTIHTRQQQYTRPTNNNYTQDNLKLATIHTRKIRIQHVQKVKTPNQAISWVCQNTKFSGESSNMQRQGQ